MENVPEEITPENFWDKDLEEIEAVFLPEETKITDLPIVLDDRILP